MSKTVDLPQMDRAAQVRAESYNADSNTIDIVWTTGASVRRYDWWDGTEYDEVLSLDPDAIRLDRLNLGAPFLDSHCSYSLDNVIGSVVPGSAKVEDGRGVATIQLSKAPGVADTVQKIAEGVIRNISVGYWLHKIVKTEGDDGTVARWDVTDWEPLEISAVPIPADPGSQIRSRSHSNKTKDGPATRSCIVVTKSKTPVSGTRAAAQKEKAVAQNDTSADEQKRRLAALRAMDEDDTASDDKRDGDDTDEEMDAEEPESKDDDSDEGRDGADGDDEDHEDDDDKAEKKDDDKRAIDDAAKRAASAAVKAERQRTSEIADIAAQAKLGELGKRHIAKGTSVRAFKDVVFRRMLERQNKRGDVSISAAATTKDEGEGEARSTTGGDAQTRAFDEAAATARKLLGIKAS